MAHYLQTTLAVSLRSIVEANPEVNIKGPREFPPDYQDTYDLGVTAGKVFLAQELLKELGERI